MLEGITVRRWSHGGFCARWRGPGGAHAVAFGETEHAAFWALLRKLRG